MDLQKIIGWLLRLVRLDTSVFDEAKGDATATSASFAVVVVASFLSGLGSLLWWMVNGPDIPGSLGGKHMGDVMMRSFVLGSVLQIALWFVWVLVTYTILVRLFRRKSRLDQLTRTMGLATLPLAVSVILFIPGVDFAIGLIAIAGAVALTSFAVQATTDASTGASVAANLAGFTVFALALSLLSSQTLPWDHLAPGVFFLHPVL